MKTHPERQHDPSRRVGREDHAAREDAAYAADMANTAKSPPTSTYAGGMLDPNNGKGVGATANSPTHPPGSKWGNTATAGEDTGITLDSHQGGGSGSQPPNKKATPAGAGWYGRKRGVEYDPDAYDKYDTYYDK